MGDTTMIGKRMDKNNELFFSDVADDAICCFFMALGEINDPTVQDFLNKVDHTPHLAEIMEKCLEEAKSQVVEDTKGFKIVEEGTL